MTPDRDRISAALGDRYQIVRELGRGGMATVWLAHDVKHDRQVAIKILHPQLAAVVGAERFLQEIHTTAKLQHPHILPLFDSGEARGLLYYVMPCLTGATLRQAIGRDKPMSIDDAVRITAEVASALDYAHRQGVIHRDIKPENILLHEGHALLADFGIAIATNANDTTRLTETGVSVGTPSYMSPEQALGERNVDARSDLYAVGAVLYEMLTGVPPFVGSTTQAIIAKVVTEKPVVPSRRRKGIPTRLDAVALTALEKNPDDRFASASDLRAAVIGELSAGRSRRGRRRLVPAIKVGVALSAVVIVAAGAIVALGKHRASPPRHVTDPAAANLVKRANYLVTRRTSGDCDQATRMLAQAANQDSLYADAWASLARADAICALFGNEDPDVLFADARLPAEQALRLDPGMADAHTTLGMVHLFHEQAFRRAEQEFVTANVLDSTAYEPWLFRAWAYVGQDHLDSAELSLRRAKQLHPAGDVIVGVRLATVLRYEQKFPESQAELDEVLQLSPGNSPAKNEQFELDVQQNLCKEAGALEPLPYGSPAQYDDAILAAFNARCGRRPLAERYADSVVKASASGRFADQFALGLVYAALADTAKMLNALHAAVAQHNWALFFLHRHFLFQPYTDLAEFRAIMAAAHVQ